ncbi:MAG: RNase P subunit p30 family protein [Candidatus Aenigmatarchaeota archaeon]
MFFYDLHVHANDSIGEDSVDDIVKTAKQLDLAGIGLARYYTTDMSFDWPQYDDIDIVKAVIIKAAGVADLENAIRAVRDKVDLLMVHGGDYAINRRACELGAVDILCHPELGRRDSGMDHITVKMARDNNVAIEINFREILETYKRHRVYALSYLKRNVFLCRKYGTHVIMTSAAVSRWQMRAGRQLASLAHVLGMELVDAVAGVSTIPETIVNTNRKKLAGNMWEGVEIK